MIRILADENVPRASIVDLREAGFDVSSVAEDLSARQILPFSNLRGLRSEF